MGAMVPEGTVVGVPHYSIMHNSDYYSQPFEYKPERWITGSSPEATAESVQMAQSAFCPFSIGPRGCIGKGTKPLPHCYYSLHFTNPTLGMAYLELTTALARIVYLYDMRLAPGSHMGRGQFGSRVWTA